MTNITPTNPVSGKAAPMNLLMSMTNATFDCEEIEHVGGHKHRSVSFLSDVDGKLSFTNTDVFGTLEIDLTANQRKDLPIKDTTTNAETEYYFKPSKAQAHPIVGGATKGGNPKIVVP